MDGFEEPYWNLIQLLAWVYLGDRELVRKASDDVTDHGSFVQQLVLPDGRKEFVETAAKAPGAVRLALEAGWKGGAALPSFEAATNETLSALRLGRLKAWGLENGRGELRPIEPIKWADLKFYYEPSFAGPKDLFRIGAVRWYGLKFSREEAMALWPDPLAAIVDDPVEMDLTTASPPSETSQEMYTRWASEITARTDGVTKRDAARTIAVREGYDHAYVEREARRVRQNHGKSGKSGNQ